MTIPRTGFISTGRAQIFAVPKQGANVMRMTLRHEPARRFSVNTPALLESDIRILDNLAPLQSFITKKIAELLG